MNEALDRDVRLFIYRRLLETGTAPSVADAAVEVDLPVSEAVTSYRRLADRHVIVLDPGTTEIWMAPPLSARPTSHLVRAGGRQHYGNCVWDALGILAMLSADGVVATTCPDCGEPLELTVTDGELAESEGVVHYAVPAARWWDDIGYT